MATKMRCKACRKNTVIARYGGYCHHCRRVEGGLTADEAEVIRLARVAVYRQQAETGKGRLDFDDPRLAEATAAALLTIAANKPKRKEGRRVRRQQQQ